MNNKIAIISAFLGGVKNRYMQYHPDRAIEEKIEIAGKIPGVQGLELCYPADFSNVPLLKKLMEDNNLGISGINVRSRRQGRWLRGSFTSSSAVERSEVVDDFKKAMDVASEMGVSRLTTCPLNDGSDYVFEMNYLKAYEYAEETFDKICSHNRDVKLCIEYKVNDPRQRCMFGTAGESLAFCQNVGANNLGVTMDIGHSIIGLERPAQALSMLHRAGKLFYVHLNDNDRLWDWDMLPGAFNTNELIEFLYYVKKVGYTDDWYAFDVCSKEVDTSDHFALTAKLTRKFEAAMEKIDVAKMDSMMEDRNPNATFEYMVDCIY